MIQNWFLLVFVGVMLLTGVLFHFTQLFNFFFNLRIGTFVFSLWMSCQSWKAQIVTLSSNSDTNRILEHADRTSIQVPILEHRGMCSIQRPTQFMKTSLPFRRPHSRRTQLPFRHPQPQNMKTGLPFTHIQSPRINTSSTSDTLTILEHEDRSSIQTPTQP